MSEILLPGGTFRNRVQGGEPPESWTWQSHLVEETEIGLGGPKETGIDGTEHQSQKLGREKGPKLCTEVP